MEFETHLLFFPSHNFKDINGQTWTKNFCSVPEMFGGEYVYCSTIPFPWPMVQENGPQVPKMDVLCYDFCHVFSSLHSEIIANPSKSEAISQSNS